MPGSTSSTTTASSAAASTASTSTASTSTASTPAAASTTTGATTTTVSAAAATTTTTTTTTPAATPTPSAASAATTTAPSSSARALAPLALARATAVKDLFLAMDPTYLTVDLLEKHLLAAETSIVAVGAAHTPFFEGCSPSPLAPSYASVAAVDFLRAEEVGAAFAPSGRHRSGRGKGGKGGGGGSGGAWAYRGSVRCKYVIRTGDRAEAAAVGASKSALHGTAPAEALHTFTLDSNASRCFFLDSTTLTPLPAPVAVFTSPRFLRT
ncbi:unnamed protein product, partial [Closterium sp. NIES-65]